MKASLIIFIGYALSYIWVILPDKILKAPFLFFKMEINLRYYADYLMARVLYCLLAYLVWDAYKTFETKIAFWLFIGFLIEYILIFNQPFMWLKGGSIHYTKPEPFFVPIGYSTFMGLALLILAIIAWIKL